MTHVDIAIIGNGLTSASLLCALKNTPLSIAILDEKPPYNTGHPPAQDGRPISLTEGSLNILDKLGLPPCSLPSSTPLYHLHISEQNQLGHMAFNAQEFQLNQLGAVIPYTQLEHTLQTQAAKKNKVQFIQTSKLLSITSPTAHQPHITLRYQTQDQQQSLSAHLLIGADGTHSFCRKQLSLPTEILHRNEQALIFELTLSSPHPHRAYQRFSRHGSMALLPLFSANKMRCVWIPSSHNLSPPSDTKALAVIQSVYQNYLPPIQACRSLGHFPLQHVFCKKPYTDGAVLLGNAAHTFYPITAQGYNLTLRDTIELANVIQHAHEKQQPLGAAHTLEQYHHHRSKDLQMTRLITRTTQDLFGLYLPGLGVARGLGLLTMQMIRPLKKRLAYRMMGLTSTDYCTSPTDHVR